MMHFFHKNHKREYLIELINYYNRIIMLKKVKIKLKMAKL
jgi:hypothetical protein